MTIYRKVEIKSEADLPQSERSMYFVGVKDNLHPEDIYEWFNYKNPVMAENQAEYWLNTFDWYLLPIELPTDEEIEKECPAYCGLSGESDAWKAGVMYIINKLTGK